MSTATINGLKILARNTISWSYRPGVRPHVEGYELAAEDGETLRKYTGSPVTLAITDPDHGIKLEVRLFVVGVLAAEEPQTRIVMLADRRWFWSRWQFLGRYNIRRRTGEQRLISSTALGAVSTADDIAYAKFSLRESAHRWRPQEIIVAMMEFLGRKQEGGYSIGVVLEDVPVEDLELSGAFDECLAQAMAYMPGLTCYVHADGELRFINEIQSPQLATAEEDPQHVVVGSGWSIRQDLSGLRPRNITVHFQREIEARFDFVAGSTTAGPGIAVLENVLPIPDASLTYRGSVVPQGTIVPIDQHLFDAWNATLPTGVTEQLTDTLLRERWFYGLWWFDHVAELSDLDSGKANWAMRIAALRQHYRQTFRVPREVMDNILALDARRLAILDVVTHTRASAQAWCDYCVFPSQRGRWFYGQETAYGMNVPGYNVALASARALPMEVQVVDREVGIIRLAYRGDPLKNIAEVVPSRVDNLPYGAAGGERGPRFENENHPVHGFMTMSADHGVAIVLTILDGAPNGMAQLERITVDPKDAETVVGRDLGRCDGPEVELRCYAMTARYAWLDTNFHSLDIKEVIGLANRTRPEDQTVILDKSWINKEDCRQVALAMAGALWASMQDRPQGRHATLMDPGARLSGSMDSMTHSIDSRGRVLTAVTLPHLPPAQYNLLSFLPAGVRRIITREVAP